MKVTIELIPGGRKELGRVIGRGSIGNISNLADLSDYTCKFEENPWQGRAYGPYAGRLTSWPRNERGAWETVHAALSELLANTKPNARK